MSERSFISIKGVKFILRILEKSDMRVSFRDSNSLRRFLSA